MGSLRYMHQECFPKICNDHSCHITNMPHFLSTVVDCSMYLNLFR